jgi:hypothetical protein
MSGRCRTLRRDGDWRVALGPRAPTDELELYSLIVDRKALDRPAIRAFSDSGDPAWEFLQSVEQEGLRVANFPFTAEHYIVHLGRGSLAAVARSHDESNPRFAWAVEHQQPHYGGVHGAQETYECILRRFQDEVGADLDLATAIRR